MEDEVFGKDQDEAAIHWYEKKPDPTWLDQVAGLVDFKSVKSTLDIGCGVGGYAHAIARAWDTQVVGVDLSRVRLLRARATYSTGHVAWVSADANALPFAEGQFDLCLMRNLLHHVGSRLEVVREAVRVLTPGGFALVESADLEKMRNHYDYRILPRLWVIDSHRYPSKCQIERLLAQVGCLEIRSAEIVRKKGQRRSVNRVLDMSQRMIEENRGPSSWKLLTTEERHNLHQLRVSELPKLYPDGLVPREWWNVAVVGRKAAGLHDRRALYTPGESALQS